MGHFRRVPSSELFSTSIISVNLGRVENNLGACISTVSIL